MVSVTASQVLDTAEMPPQIHFWRHSIFLRSNIGLRSPLIILSGDSAGKESTYNAEDLGSNPGSRRAPGERNAYTNSSILARQVPWTEQAAGCVSHRVSTAAWLCTHTPACLMFWEVHGRLRCFTVTFLHLRSHLHHALTALLSCPGFIPIFAHKLFP